MAELAHEILLDTETGVLVVDGAEFPWLYANGVPSVEDGPDGTPVPAITLTILASQLEIISSYTVVPDEQG